LDRNNAIQTEERKGKGEITQKPTGIRLAKGIFWGKRDGFGGKCTLSPIFL